MSNTIRLRPFNWRTLQMHQIAVAGGWKNRTIPQDVLDGDWSDKYPSDEGNWMSCDDNFIYDDHPHGYEPGWFEQTRVRRSKLRRLVMRRRCR